MAVLTAQQIASLSLEILKRRLVLPMTASRIQPSQLAGPTGGTVTVRVRHPRTAFEQATGGTDISGNLSELQETPVDVSVTLLHDGTVLSDYDLSLNLEDFGQQVLEPLVSSVAVAAENQLAGAWNDEPEHATIEFAATASEDDTKAVILEARETLTRNGVPLGNRFALVSPEIATRVLDIDHVSDADASGQTGALRDATIGRYRGFTFVESAGLDEDTAIFTHRSGAVWANRAPSEASGTDSSTRSQDGISLRVVRDFNPNTAAEVALVSTFAGASVVYEDADESSPGDAERFIKVGVGS